MFKYLVKDPWVADKKSTEPEELKKRLLTLETCISLYSKLYRTSKDFELDMKRPDINLTCKQPMDGVKDFINQTGARYENVYSPIAPWMIKNIKNTEL
jgi:hypothetical protein